MSEKKVEIKTLDGNLYVTKMDVLHGKLGKKLPYLSFSDGQNVMGVYLGEKTIKEIVKFLTVKKGEQDGK